MDYFSVAEVSRKWGICTRRVQVLCKQGRIAGAEHIGRAWIIPKNAERPADLRCTQMNGENIRENNDAIK